MRQRIKALTRCVGITFAAALALSSCSGAKDGPSAETTALMAEAKAFRPEQIEAKANEISQNDYRMFRSLMASGGLDEELGGAARGDAALRGLMMQYRQSLLGARADLPRIIKIADGDTPGLAGLGASFFAGLVVTSLIVKAVNGSGEKSGAIGGDVNDGSLKASFTEQQTTTDSTFKGEMDGLRGTIRTKITLDTCPKPDGAITIDFLSDSSLTKVGGTAGANVKVTGKLTWFVNDDAEFGDNFDSDIRVENASFGGSRGTNGGFVDYTEKSSTVVAGNNSGVVNRQSSKATADDRATAEGAAKFARLMLMAAAYQAKDAFQSGQCVKLEPTSDPTKRSGVKPKTSFALLAAPRSKFDGTPTGGSVTATLTGEGSLDPAGTKVPADAKFTYVAPDAKNKKGSVAFEARSKRGVGKGSLDFDTMDRAYAIDGGGGEFRGTGKTCNLTEPFTVRGNAGIVVKFKPKSDRGGAYDYTGQIAGCRLYGAGTYTVGYNGETPVSITGTGPGSAACPLGTSTRTDTEKYKLTPVEGGSCE